MAQRRYHVILNSRAGTANALGLTAETLRARFEAQGLEVEVDDSDDKPIEARIDEAVRSSADTIVVGGGDGTIRSVAQALVDTDKSLAVLPLGTYNALSKDLGMPADIDAAIAALPTLEEGRMDVAELNGQVFLHNVLIGVIPGIAVGREHVRGNGIGAWIGFFRFMLRRLTRVKPMAIAIELDSSARRVERLHSVAVTNNAYTQQPGAFLQRERMDKGRLSIHTIKTLGLADAARLAFEMFAGTWKDDDVVTTRSGRQVALHSHRPNLLVTIDGDVQTFETPLRFSMRPLALSVLAAPAKQAALLADPLPIEA